MHETSPLGMPAASPAATITLTASAVQFLADGCGATMTALRALTPIRILKIAVEVGLVDGVSATITPTGQPISTILFTSSRRSTPQVGTSLMESHTPWAANSFFSLLCAAYPKPVSSWASWPSRSASRTAAATIASQILSTCCCEANWNDRMASRAPTARSRACWIDRRSASIVVWLIESLLDDRVADQNFFGAAATSSTASRRRTGSAACVRATCPAAARRTW